MGHDVVADYRAARRLLGVVPQELVFDPFFSVREALRIQSGYFGIRDNEAWIDEILENLDLVDKAGHQHAPALRRHEAARAGGAGPGAPAAGDRARRADRRRRRRAAPGPVGVHPPAQPRWPHHRADDALPGGGGKPVRAHRHAQAGAHRRAGHHRQPAAALLRAHAAPAPGAGHGAARIAARASQRRRRRGAGWPSTTASRSSRCWRTCARPAAASSTSRSASPISRKSSCASWSAADGRLPHPVSTRKCCASGRSASRRWPRQC
jgi:hypothetical protein